MDFSKILPDHTGIKIILSTAVIAGLFWYVDMYFFGAEYFLRMPYYIPIIICFCLGLAWSILIQFVLSMSFDREKHPTFNSVMVNVYVSTLGIGLVSFIEFKYQAPFASFVKCSFYTIAFVFVVTLLLKLKKRHA